MLTKVRFIEAFKDGSIFPKAFAPGEEAVLTQNEVDRVRNSGGMFEVVDHLIRNPLKDEKLAVAREDMPDPINPHNGINEEDHVPGLEDEVEEVKSKAKNKKK